MKKRFFNALILGAVLLSTGAVTSCKDYDDDISNLQEQVNKLSQLESLKTDVATLQSAVSAAQNDATKALADAKAASDKADKAATADQVKAVQAAIDAANELIAKKADKTEVEALQKLVNEYKDNLDKLSSEAAGMLEDAIKKSALASEVAELKKQVEAITNPEEGGAENLKTLTAKYNTLKAQAEDLGIAVSSMITGIELFGTTHETDVKGIPNHTLTFTTTAEVDNVFGPDGGTKIEFKKGNWATYGDEVVVRVTPVDANLTPDMITLINSQGAVLEDVEVEGVERFNTLITSNGTRAAAQNTGLWTIKFNLAKDYDSEAFTKATIVNKKSDTKYDKVLFAVAVDAKVDAEVLKDKDASRSVVSEFDLDMAVVDGVRAKDFSVNKTLISEIRNRFHNTENRVSTTDKEDYVWAASTKEYPTPAIAIDKDKKNVVAKADQIKNCQDVETPSIEHKGYYGYKDGILYGDCRQAEDLLAVEVGTPITIDYSCVYDENGAPNKFYNDGQKVAGFYVTLDRTHAVESGVSEINSWDSYEYEGLNTLLGVDENGKPTNKGQITIKNLNNVKGDIIGFRVYAVNLDGTLLDPDGRAFYVAVGGVVTDGNVAAATLDIKIDGKDNKSDIVALGTDINVGKYMGDWIPSSKNPKYGNNISSPAFDVVFYKEDGKTVTTDRSKAKYVQFVIPAGNEKLYIDGETYTQTLQLYDKADDNSTNLLVKTITATMTKKMPTDVPAYKFRPGQQLDANNKPSTDEAYNTGKFRAYLTPDGGSFVAGSDKIEGYVNMNQILYNQLGGNYKFDKLNFNFKNATYKKDDNNKYTDKKDDLKVDGENKVVVPVKNIDNKTEYTVVVSYNYGKISNAKVDGKWETGTKDYLVASPNNLTAIFSCWHYASTFEWQVDELKDKDGKVTGYKSYQPSLQWSHQGGQDVAEANLANVLHKNTYDGSFFGKTLAEVLFTNSFFAVAETAHLKSKEGQVDPYFYVTISNGMVYFNQSQTVNAPGIDHEEILEIVVKDAFKDHKTTIKLPVTIKKP